MKMGNYQIGRKWLLIESLQSDLKKVFKDEQIFGGPEWVRDPEVSSLFVKTKEYVKSPEDEEIKADVKSLLPKLKGRALLAIWKVKGQDQITFDFWFVGSASNAKKWLEDFVAKLGTATGSSFTVKRVKEDTSKDSFVGNQFLEALVEEGLTKQVVEMETILQRGE